MKSKTIKLLSFMFAAALLLAGCFWNDDVQPSGIGVVSDGGALDSGCLGPGLHNDGRLYSHLIEVPISALTFDVADPSVATADTQLVGITVAVQIQRNADCGSIHNLLTNWPSLLDDTELERVATTQVSQGIKIAVRKYTLQGLLDDRSGVTDAIREDLQAVTTKFGVNVLNVSVKDIALDPAYEAKLHEKQLITVDIDIAVRKQDQVKAEQETARIIQEQRAETLKQQLLAEQAQTNVQVEIAARDGKVIAAANEVYKTNEQAFELERIRQLKGLLSATDKVYFVPEGTDLTLFISGLQGTPVPVPVTNP